MEIPNLYPDYDRDDLNSWKVLRAPHGIGFVILDRVRHVYVEHHALPFEGEIWPQKEDAEKFAQDVFGRRGIPTREKFEKFVADWRLLNASTQDPISWEDYACPPRICVVPGCPRNRKYYPGHRIIFHEDNPIMLCGPHAEIAEKNPGLLAQLDRITNKEHSIDTI